MQERTDDQLDDLFRKSAEEFDPPFDPTDWQTLRSRLDARNRPLLGSKGLRWGLPLLLLLLIGTVWYAYRYATRLRPALRPTTAGAPAATPAAEQPNTNRVVLTDRPRADQPAAHKPAEPVPGRTGTLPINPLSAAGPASVGRPAKALAAGRATVNAEYITKPSFGRSPRSAVATAIRPPAKRNRSVGSRRLTHRLIPPSVGTSADLPKPSFAGNRYGQQLTRRIGGAGPTTPIRRWAASSRPTPGTEAPAGPTPAQTADTEPAGTNSLVVTNLTTRSFHWPTLPTLPAGRNVAARPDTTGAQRTAPPPAQRGLSVRFVVSPDLTAIGLRNFDRPGTNVGLLGEYRFGARWSVQAGVMRSTKVYKATSEQYTYPAHTYWKVWPESVAGQCNMLDIPLNLRYDWALRSRPSWAAGPPARWFVSGGVTTYVMLRETYDFLYADPSDPNIKVWQTKAQTGAYGFSTLNLSAGYERPLSRRLSWQIEPFLKIPLRSVGYYQVKLLSTGAFLSIRYKL